MAMAALMAPLLRRLARPPQALAPPQHARSVVTIKKFTADRARRHAKEPKSALSEAKDGGSAPFSPSIEPRSGDDKAPERAVVRLAKRIAMSGLCSRREAEKLIQKRQVTVNGKVASELATNVHVLSDQVAVDGKLLPRAAHGDKPLRTKVWMANKLKGELVTANDPQGRATIFDRLRVMGLTQHMMPVGRLDFNTEGLLLFTNDGDYARQLEHPKSDVTRVYRVLVRGNVSESKLLELRRGPTIDGIKYRSIHATVQSTDKKDSWLQVRITEGKNREIRKALAHVRLVVKQLVRVQYGPYRLADLPAGAVLAVRPKLLDESRTKQTKKPKKDKPTKEEEVDSA